MDLGGLKLNLAFDGYLLNTLISSFNLTKVIEIVRLVLGSYLVR